MIEMLLIFAFLMFIFGLGTGYMIFGRDAKKVYVAEHGVEE